MGYLDIDNLYKARDILIFRECYALEKIHGTSAHIAWKDGTVRFFAGGVPHEHFVALFDQAALAAAFTAAVASEAIIYGEAYGGKCQGMSATYGKQLRFVAFDVRIGRCWLAVPQAEEFVKPFGLEFVAWATVPTTIEALDAERAKPSVQAVRNGIAESRPREGIVLRPPIEVVKNNGARIIAKHKNDAFKETKTARPLDAGKLKVLSEADAIASEWVTEMRLTHVLDGLGGAVGIERMPDVIRAMIADVEREGSGEIVASKDARRAIGTHTVRMFKARLVASLRGEA